MPPAPPRRRPARPVADAPIDALLSRTEELAKGWLLTLLEQEPLEHASELLATDLTRDGPRICEALVRALADDRDLRQLDPGGALEALVGGVGSIAGAATPEATVRTVDALQAVIWSAVHGELRSPASDQVTELAERLALVMEAVRGAALRRGGEARSFERGPAAPGPARLRVAEEIPAADARSASHITDTGSASRPADALWIAALEDEIERARGAAAPLSLLLVELEEAARMLAVEPATMLDATFGRFAQAVRGALRRDDLLVCETASRVWVIARETSRLGAQALGARIAASVAAQEPWRGAPLAVSVGVAVLGEDGQDRASMIEAAEEARFAAAASGIEIIRAGPDEST